MQTIDLRQIMADHDITHSEARERIRKKLKDGTLWSRLNPDLLKEAELLPSLQADSPPKSPGEILPFPVPTNEFKQLNKEAEDYPLQLAMWKTSWTAKSPHSKHLQNQSSPIMKTALRQIASYYDIQNPRIGLRYTWIDLDQEKCPINSVLKGLLPAFRHYKMKDEDQLAQDSAVLEIWQTEEPDTHGAHLMFSTVQEDEDNLVFAPVLGKGDKIFFTARYRLSPDRYAFLRQQMMFLVGHRLISSQEASATSPARFRGRIYRKPSPEK